VEATSLTSLTVGGGCAAKYSAARLEELLKGFVPAEAEDLLVGLDPADDAAVYRLDDERALVFTIDFFPPLVDDPELFGRIAATNALNDVFAMGGTPLLALSVAAFPEELATDLVAAVFRGADEQVRAAGAILAGGHTIRDTEPKYGLAVVGTVHPDGVWVKSGAQPGDAVFLTKPLGTGLVLATKGDLAEAARWMTTLNDRAAEVLRPFLPHAVTDVTGFGLLGHALEMCRGAGLAGQITAEPPLLDGVEALARDGVCTGASGRNWASYGEAVVLPADLPDWRRALLTDPQTSGGLLIACAPDAADAVLARVQGRGFDRATVVGRLSEGPPQVQVA
jgi:selenide,water dikinase